MSEEWRDVVGHGGAYQVSDLGRVRSLDRVVIGRNGCRLPIKGKVRTPMVDKDGYHTVLLAARPKNQNKRIHALVAEAFISPRPSPEHMALHFDGDPQNNVPGNLRWGTNSENQLDRRHQGTAWAGEKNRRARLTEAQARLISTLEGFTLHELAGIFGVNFSTIWDIQNGRSWRTFEWSPGYVS